MIIPKNIIHHELIGLEVEVIEAKTKTQKGIKGLVVNETKHMLWIETQKSVKKIPKKCTKFLFALPDGKKVIVSGDVLVARPEERIKTKSKRWW